MIEIKQCPVCWGKGEICVDLTDDLEPITQGCPGCDGTGWIAFKSIKGGNTVKHWYKSKTLWVNVGAILIVVIEYLLVKQIVYPELHAAVLAIINIGLRAVTKSGLTR